MKKFVLLIAFLLFITSAVYAENNSNDNYVGVPKGFYDDIDPKTLDEEENTEKSVPKTETDYQKENGVEHILEDDGVIIPDTKTKATKNYSQIYNDLEMPDFSYLHNIDPDQYYDMKDTAWSVYPLLRLNSPIYFKSITVEPGYYLLTPRENNGKWYMLFKQNGIVKYIIPVYDRDYTPETFYKEHIPKPKLTPSQKVHMGILSAIGHVKSSKRKDPIKSYLEVNDLENYFVSIVIYYGPHKYSTIFRTIRL